MEGALRSPKVIRLPYLHTCLYSFNSIMRVWISDRKVAICLLPLS
jgi:hypothetical protein